MKSYGPERDGATGAVHAGVSECLGQRDGVVVRRRLAIDCLYAKPLYDNSTTDTFLSAYILPKARLSDLSHRNRQVRARDIDLRFERNMMGLGRWRFEATDHELCDAR